MVSNLSSHRFLALKRVLGIDLSCEVLGEDLNPNRKWLVIPITCQERIRDFRVLSSKWDTCVTPSPSKLRDHCAEMKQGRHTVRARGNG